MFQCDSSTTLLVKWKNGIPTYSPVQPYIQAVEPLVCLHAYWPVHEDMHTQSGSAVGVVKGHGMYTVRENTNTRATHVVLLE